MMNRLRHGLSTSANEKREHICPYSSTLISGKIRVFDFTQIFGISSMFWTDYLTDYRTSVDTRSDCTLSAF